MFGLLFIITTVLLPLMCQSSPVDLLDESAQWTDQHAQQQQDQLEQEQYTCLLRSNKSLVNDFQQSVREKHGINDPGYGMCMHIEGLYIDDHEAYNIDIQLSLILQMDDIFLLHQIGIFAAGQAALPVEMSFGV